MCERRRWRRDIGVICERRRWRRDIESDVTEITEIGHE